MNDDKNTTFHCFYKSILRNRLISFSQKMISWNFDLYVHFIIDKGQLLATKLPKKISMKEKVTKYEELTHQSWDAKLSIYQSSFY